MPRWGRKCASPLLVSLFFFDFGRGLLTQRFVKPGAGISPVPRRGSAQLDQLSARLVHERQPFKSIVEGDQLLIARMVRNGEVIQIDALPAAAALEAFFVARVVEEDAPHCFRGRREEMSPAVPEWLRLISIGENKLKASITKRRPGLINVALLVSETTVSSTTATQFLRRLP